MPLRIETFRNDIGGSSVYKAISHPLVAEPAKTLVAKLAASGPVSLYDPDGILEAFDLFYPLDGAAIAGFFVQNVGHLERTFRGHRAQPVTALADTSCNALLIASFDQMRALRRIGHLLPFRRGFERIMKDVEAPIIPIALDGVWGSIFSFERGRFLWKVPRRIPYHVTVSFGRPMPPSSTGGSPM